MKGAGVGAGRPRKVRRPPPRASEHLNPPCCSHGAGRGGLGTGRDASPRSQQTHAGHEGSCVGYEPTILVVWCASYPPPHFVQPCLLHRLDRHGCGAGGTVTACSTFFCTCPCPALIALPFAPCAHLRRSQNKQNAITGLASASTHRTESSKVLIKNNQIMSWGGGYSAHSQREDLSLPHAVMLHFVPY